MKQQAFTLIEILIALFIFAILGMITVIALTSAIKSHKQITDIDNRLQSLATTMTLLRYDSEQIIDRSIINNNGEKLPALLSLGPQAVSFTRAGFSNPMQLAKRSELQRVAYVLDKQKLVRLTWDVVDQAPSSAPLKKILLTGVTEFNIQYLNKHGQIIHGWQQKTLPRALIINLRVKGLGFINDVLPIMARGFKLAKQTQKKSKRHRTN